MNQEYMGATGYRKSISLKEKLGYRERLGVQRENILRKQVYAFVKRVSDIAISLCGMLFLFPVFLVLAALVYISDPGPVFFGHERLGKNGKKIKIWKFRSMRVNAEEIFAEFTEEQKAEFYREFKLEQDPRITAVGGFLRKSSLDELPQLFNIMKGDLSLVGPRPVVKEELEKYGDEKEEFLSVKPGLTGYWQANGRNLINYENGRKEMELYYVRHQSMLLDVKILFRTVGAVVKGKGAQ